MCKWVNDSDFLIAKAIVDSGEVVNDPAERTVQLGNKIIKTVRLAFLQIQLVLKDTKNTLQTI